MHVQVNPVDTVHRLFIYLHEHTEDHKHLYWFWFVVQPARRRSSRQVPDFVQMFALK